MDQPLSISLVLSLAAVALGIAWLMPRSSSQGSTNTNRIIGLGLIVAGGIGYALTVPVSRELITSEILFWFFAGSALLSACLMITSKNPIYGALWFALVTLALCGLYMLQSAPFLAAATMTVYAGAIIVTFVFVIMLAQQSGKAYYDQQARHPWIATISGFVLLGAVLTTLSALRVTEPTAEPVAIQANELSRPAADEPLGRMNGLGRSLFGDYLFAVELGGTLLLIASVGACVIAPRKEQGAL